MSEKLTIRLTQNHHRPTHLHRMLGKPMDSRELTLQRRKINAPTPIPTRNLPHRTRTKPTVSIVKKHPSHAES